MKENILKICLLLGSIILCLGFIEVYFRIFNPQAIQPESIHEYAFGINNGLRANIHQRWEDKDYDVEVTTNTRRLRDYETDYVKADGVFRILALGDSYTFGFGVNLGQTYPKVLEKQLNSADEFSSDRKIEVINAGAPGWGTAQELVFFIEEGRKYEPDIVTLCFSGNDPHDNINSGLFGLEGDRLVRLIPEKNAITIIRELIRNIPFMEYVAGNSHFYNYVRMHLLHAMYNRISRTNRAGDDVGQESEQGTLQEDYQEALTIAIMRELIMNLQNRGIRFIIFDVQGQLQKFPAVYRFLKDTMDNQDIYLLETSEYFDKFVLDHKTTYLADGHWNVKGHRLAADQLTDFMRNQSWISESGVKVEL